MKPILFLLLTVSLIQAQTHCFISFGDSVIEERTNGRLERLNAESIGNDVLVQRNLVYRWYSERGGEILSTVYTCRRAVAGENLWRVESVVESLYDPAVKPGRVFHSWRAERVAELPLVVSRCNVVGRNDTRIDGRTIRRAGQHSWSVRVATDPWPSPVMFACLAMPEKGPRICRLDWRVEMPSGVFTPSTEPPTASYCSQLGGIGLLTVSVP